MRRSREHGVYIVLVFGRHCTDSLAAASLRPVLADRHTLYIAAVGQSIDALLLLDEVLYVYLVRDVLYLRDPVVSVPVAQLDKLVLQDSLDFLGIFKQLPEVFYFLLELPVLLFELLTVETLQGYQAHVADSLSLNVTETEALHKALLCIVVAGAYDMDDFVDIVLSDEQTFQQVCPLLRLAQIILCAADDYLLLERQILVEYMAQGEYFRL